VLARDKRTDRSVAIKIIRDVKRYRQNARIEAHILRDLRRADPQGLRRCSILYGTFVHEDRFFCLVCEPLGPSLYAALKQNAYRGFWLQDLQSFASQCLVALTFLHHTLRMTHTDMKPENILLQSMEPSRPCHFPREAFWKDAQGLPCVPPSPYLRPVDARIKLIDFGNAASEHDNHSCTISTRQYRSPEVVLECGWDERSDIWSLGCILIELYTGDLLFSTHESLQHLAMMEKLVQRLPLSVLVQASPSAKKSYLIQEDGEESVWRLRWPEGASSPSVERHVRDQRPLSVLVLRQHQLLAAFVEWLLTADRRERPSADEAARHPFLFACFDD